MSPHVQKLLEAQTVECNLSLRYYRATFSIRNGVKWLLWDTGKIGEASDAGELSCLDKVGETSQPWKLPWRILEHGRRFQGAFEVGEIYQIMEVASSSRKSQQYNRRALLRIPIPCHHMDRCHKTTHQTQQQLDPDNNKQAGSKWSWNLRPRPPNYELAVAFIGNGTEIWGHVRQITTWQWHHRVREVKEKLAFVVHAVLAVVCFEQKINYKYASMLEFCKNILSVLSLSFGRTSFCAIYFWIIT